MVGNARYLNANNFRTFRKFMMYRPLSNAKLRNIPQLTTHPCILYQVSEVHDASGRCFSGMEPRVHLSCQHFAPTVEPKNARVKGHLRQGVLFVFDLLGVISSRVS